jgi:hypothetical protein
LPTGILIINTGALKHKIFSADRGQNIHASENWFFFPLTLVGEGTKQCGFSDISNRTITGKTNKIIVPYYSQREPLQLWRLPFDDRSHRYANSH